MIFTSDLRTYKRTDGYIGYLVKADCYECVDSRSNGEAEITHLRQLFLRMQEHLITYKHLIIHNDRYTVYVRRRTDNPKTHRRFRKNITQ